MLLSLWRSLRKSDPSSTRGKDLPNGRRLSLWPQLEALEDRTLPAPLVYGVLPPAPAGTTSAVFVPPPPQPVAIAASGALSGLQPISSQPANEAANQMKVTVMENSPKTVIDLGPVFAQMSGLHPEDGLQLSLLGNTNPGLVKTDLSEGELTLTYTPSQCGTATISVGATDADSVSVRENILVTVLPLPSTKPGGSSPIPAGQQTLITPSTFSLAYLGHVLIPPWCPPSA
jgi:hypothetical protein